MKRYYIFILCFYLFNIQLFAASADETDDFVLNKTSQPISPTIDPKKGVLDGDRRAPQRISFTPDQIAASNKVKHVIVIYQENWSFDSLYGKFAGANGLANASLGHTLQIDLIGKPYSKLPVCINAKVGLPYPQIPENLPNGPFNLQPFLSMDAITGDAIHDFYLEQYQINGGAMNRFSTYSNAGGFALSYYDITPTSMGKIAQEYVLCDNWFHSCYGGSMCGVLWLFTAQMPLWPNGLEEHVAKVLPSGALIKDGLISPDGYAINDAEPFYAPFKKGTPVNKRVPPQTYKTIGDLLSEKEISWKWYAEGWTDAINGDPDPTFVFHHQAPVYFKQFSPDTEMRDDHLADLDQLYDDLKKDLLPSVCFIRSLDRHSQHPGDSTLKAGLDWCANLIKIIQASNSWNDCVIIVTYDENGGRWDHVSPPVVDRFGPGTRIPAIIISPFAKKGFIDHTSYETVSILKFVEDRWQLKPLSTRDAAANNILNAFDFNKNPNAE